MNRFIFFMLSAGVLHTAGQVKFSGLRSSGSAVWKGELYVFGVRSEKKATRLTVYRLGQAMEITDSIVSISAPWDDGYLRCWCDNVHNFLNIYFQPSGTDLITVMRLDPKHRLVATIKNVQTARLNNSGMLGADPYFFSAHVYKVHSRSDTAGKQFYLNCYELKDPKENFDYILKWQFPFERKNVAEAFVIHADRHRVTLFADVSGGVKKGQWLLSVDARNGQLIKGTRIGKKEAKAPYRYGITHMDTIKKTLHLMCQEVSPSTRSAVSLIYMATDSSGETQTMTRFSIPWAEAKRGNSKAVPEMNIRFDKVRPLENGISFEADIYIRLPKQSCYNYCNTLRVDLDLSGETPRLSKTILRSNRVVEDWLYLQDKTLVNGRLCTDSAGNTPDKHSLLPFPVKLGFRYADKPERLLLQKVETSRSQVSYAVYGPEKGKMKIIPLATVKKALVPQMHFHSDTTYILRQDTDSSGVQLRKGVW